MLVALIIAVLIGAAAGAATTLDHRASVADDLKLAVLIGVSGAVAGWAIVDTILAVGHDHFDVADVLGALLGAAALLALAWRGHHRPIAEREAPDA